MKFKRILIALCALALICVLCLSACKQKEQDGTDSASPAPLGINLSEYTVVRSTDAKQKLAEICVEFAESLSRITDSKINVGNDTNANDAPEILIGDTTRPESAEAKARIEGEGYIITQIGKKIVINASNGMILEDAMNFFLESAITKLSDNTFEIPTEYKSNPYSSLSVLSSGKTDYALIYAKDDEKFNKELAEGVAAKLAKISNGSFTVLPESQKSDAKNHIFIGNIEGLRDTRFNYYQYGVAINGNDIYLCGANRTLLSKSCEAFGTRMSRYGELVKKSTSDITVYYTELFTLSDTELYFDIPLPEGLTPVSMQTRVGGAVLVYQDTEQSVFQAYASSLQSTGFESQMTNENAVGKYALYRKGDNAAYFYYLNETKDFYVTFEKYQDIPTWTSSNKTVSTPTMTQLGYEYTSVKEFISNGMCYITALEDGSYVIVDGGRRDDQKQDLADELYEYLKANNKRADKSIVISAWIITHGHVDHYQTLEFFGQKYGDKVILEYLMYCYPDEIELRHEENSGDGYFTENFDKILASYKGAKAYIPHMGEIFNIKNLFVEIIGTYELLYPQRLDEGNDCCMTFRFTFNKGQSNESTVMFLGDIYADMSSRLEKIYGSYLKSDVVQVAHHGWDNGGSMMLYRKIKADHALWSNCYKHLYADTQESSQGYGVYIRKILESINAHMKFYPTTSISGKPRNTVLTFGNTLTIS